MSPLRLKVGELARRTGLSVRTLHHYDELGLLRPSGRTGSGHRVYQEVEVRRLQKILSLKQLGLSLQEIQRVLDHEEQSLLDILERHRAHLSAENERVRTLLATLTRLTKQLRRAEDISVDAFLESIEQTIMVENTTLPSSASTWPNGHSKWAPSASSKCKKSGACCSRVSIAHASRGSRQTASRCSNWRAGHET